MMDDFSAYCLYSDLDSTLLAEDKTVPLRNTEAIARFKRGGGRFGIATGRSPHNLNMGLDLSLVNAPSILCNGAVIYDIAKGEYLHCEYIDKAQATLTAHRIMRARPDATVQICTEKSLYQVNPNPERWEDPLVIKEDIPIIQCRIDEIAEPWIKMVVPAQPECIDELERMLGVDPPDCFTMVKSGEIYLEILGRGVSKGSAVRSLRSMLGGQISIMAIGDYYNDLEMLLTADISAAPLNAPEDIRSRVGYTACHNDEGAVADFLSAMLFERRAQGAGGKI